MPALTIVLEGDGSFPELQGRKIHHVTESFKVTALAGGMESGAPSVAFCIPLDDGSVVLCETSLKIFLTAAEAFLAKHGDPR